MQNDVIGTDLQLQWEDWHWLLFDLLPKEIFYYNNEPGVHGQRWSSTVALGCRLLLFSWDPSISFEKSVCNLGHFKTCNLHVVWSQLQCLLCTLWRNNWHLVWTRLDKSRKEKRLEVNYRPREQSLISVERLVFYCTFEYVGTPLYIRIFPHKWTIQRLKRWIVTQ